MNSLKSSPFKQEFFIPNFTPTTNQSFRSFLGSSAQGVSMSSNQHLLQDPRSKKSFYDLSQQNQSQGRNPARRSQSKNLMSSPNGSLQQSLVSQSQLMISPHKKYNLHFDYKRQNMQKASIVSQDISQENRVRQRYMSPEQRQF